LIQLSSDWIAISLKHDSALRLQDPSSEIFQEIEARKYLTYTGVKKTEAALQMGFSAESSY